MPKENSTCMTPEGEATVMENDALRQEVKVKIVNEGGGITIKRFPLADINAKSIKVVEENDDEE